jgi:hypothetical protein
LRRVSLGRVQRRLSADWLARARALIIALAAANTLQRARLIKKNAALWSEIKEALWAAGGEKCWYSEVLLPLGAAEVEHFRPKGRLSGELFAGYWWLAFDWRNYRVASHLANTRRYDKVNKGLRGKGSYFPLSAGIRANYIAVPPAHDPLCVACEAPLLLDPTDISDTKLLTFDQDGLPGPDPVRCNSQVLKDRVEKSVAFYSLDDGVLNGRRADIWRQVLGWSEEIEILMAEAEAGPLNMSQEERLRILNNLIADSVDQGAEFSSVAMAALRIRGDRGWNTAVLNAAD